MSVIAPPTRRLSHSENAYRTSQLSHHQYLLSQLAAIHLPPTCEQQLSPLAASILGQSPTALSSADVSGLGLDFGGMLHSSPAGTSPHSAGERGWGVPGAEHAEGSRSSRDSGSSAPSGSGSLLDTPRHSAGYLGGSSEQGMMALDGPATGAAGMTIKEEPTSYESLELNPSSFYGQSMANAYQSQVHPQPYASMESMEGWTQGQYAGSQMNVGGDWMGQCQSLPSPAQDSHQPLFPPLFAYGYPGVQPPPQSPIARTQQPAPPPLPQPGPWQQNFPYSYMAQLEHLASGAAAAVAAAPGAGMGAGINPQQLPHDQANSHLHSSPRISAPFSGPSSNPSPASTCDTYPSPLPSSAFFGHAFPNADPAPLPSYPRYPTAGLGLGFGVGVGDMGTASQGGGTSRYKPRRFSDLTGTATSSSHAMNGRGGAAGEAGGGKNGSTRARRKSTCGTDAGGAGGGEQLKSLDKKERRRMQNRLAQRAFRARSKAQHGQVNRYITDLEDLHEDQSDRIVQMNSLVVSLQRDNAALKAVRTGLA